MYNHYEKLTQNIASVPKVALFSDDHRDAIGHDVGKTMCIVPMLKVETSIRKRKYSKKRDSGHISMDVNITKQSVTTQPKSHIFRR